MFHQVVYISRATKLLSTEDLSNLLKKARQRNAEYSLTGMLLYKDQSFIQLLEGGKVSLDLIYDAIKKDQRHTRVKTIIERETDTRTFKNWSMGFANLDTDSPINIEGFTDFFSDSESITNLIDKPSDALELLKYFRAAS